ncbi:HlyD family efflux transporter periplasmic adaptor subunit [Aphanothece sacrum]|uniref:Secretion protein HlyD family protein n=1 Tax=Aphanothece sacrum FPU1 TaxID=1920663 RepID=A0A401IDS9_APHSA|nr:HlyD family efflux transporter periplasmic adaptor subunit [Aphanothece sacrum]GBF79453.1 secretion protein HlyD family protein [Aphanothece sacrum FPU1]GBF85997.1 secretion protein HlyD family protein [Aphanothece sacrum FPU3]
MNGINGKENNVKQDELVQTSNNGNSAALKASGNNDPFSQNALAPITSEQAVVLRQSPSWSRAIVWTIIGVTTASVLWAALASIEQVVAAKGQLKPQAAVKDIQPPINGVVDKVLIKDGDHVKEGQILLTLDSEATAAELRSLKTVKQSLKQENEFYKTLMSQSLDTHQVEREIIKLKLPQEVASLTRNRTGLVAENQLYQIQLGENVPGINLNIGQVQRLRASQGESSSRAMAAQLETEQLQKQLKQAQLQLADAQKQLIDDQKVLAEIKSRNEKALQEAKSALVIEEGILQDIEPLQEEGGVARLQVERQKQSISERKQKLTEQISNGTIEYDKQRQQIQQRLGDIGRFTQEERRLELAIEQGDARLTNTVDLTEKDIRDKISVNQQKIAEIDSQLTKIIVENDKRIAEIGSQMSRATVTLKYQAIKAPVTGTVFDLKATPGYVPPPNQTEPLLKIVPDDNLIAEVDITNEDIGFVSTGQKADVRIDSFPFSEFGDIKGKVLSIGSDALEPNEIQRFYRFPAKIKLDQQFLKVEGREIPLQSGMSVSVNIKVRENRTVLSLFTELFTNKVESLKKVR